MASKILICDANSLWEPIDWFGKVKFSDSRLTSSIWSPIIFEYVGTPHFYLRAHLYFDISWFIQTHTHWYVHKSLECDSLVQEHQREPTSQLYKIVHSNFFKNSQQEQI
jgi:hypothetical protein